MTGEQPQSSFESADSGRPLISAIVTTFNEEYNIKECLESLLWCDEVLVVDSYSTDRTVEIVNSFEGVRLEQRTYYGSAAQKNWAIDQTQNEWILIFDADERCTQPLREEIEKLLTEGPDRTAYVIRRRVYFLNHEICFSGFQHDEVVRLFQRDKARYPNRRVHADMVTEGPTRRLKSRLRHYMVYDLSEYFQRITRYGIWGASQLWRDGKKSGLVQVIFRPWWRFFRTYIIQFGILDGLHGFVFCAIQAYGTFAKWGILWGWRAMEKFGWKPDLPEFDDSDETWEGLDGLTPRQDP